MKNPPPVVVVVAVGLILIALAGIGSLTYLLAQFDLAPEIVGYLIAPISGALGALGALLAGRSHD